MQDSMQRIGSRGSGALAEMRQAVRITYRATCHLWAARIAADNAKNVNFLMASDADYSGLALSRLLR